MTFARLSVANVQYGLFGKLQEGSPPALQITTGSVIATYYGKYGELLEGLEDQLMLDNDKIARDRRDAGDARTAENAGDEGDLGDAGEAGNVGDAEDAGKAGDKEASRDNEGGEQEDAEVGNDEGGHGGVGVGGVTEDVELGNDGVGDGAGNQDNRRATVEDVEDSDDVVVDPIDGVLADVLAHLFGLLSPRSNLPPSVIAACFIRSHGNKFRFPFISLLTLLQGLTEFLMSGVVVRLALPALSPHRSGAKKFIAVTTRAFSMSCICLLASNTYV